MSTKGKRARPTAALRFATDAPVSCKMGDHDVADWQPGRVLPEQAKNSRGKGKHVYTVMLHNGGLAFAPADSNECIRAREISSSAVMAFKLDAPGYAAEGQVFTLLPYNSWEDALDRDGHIDAIPEHLYEDSGETASLEEMTRCPQCAFDGPGTAGDVKFYSCGESFPGVGVKPAGIAMARFCGSTAVCEKCAVWCKTCLQCMCKGCDNYTRRGKCAECAEDNEDGFGGGDY